VTNIIQIYKLPVRYLNSQIGVLHRRCEVLLSRTWGHQW